MHEQEFSDSQEKKTTIVLHAEIREEIDNWFHM